MQKFLQKQLCGQPCWGGLNYTIQLALIRFRIKIFFYPLFGEQKRQTLIINYIQTGNIFFAFNYLTPDF